MPVFVIKMLAGLWQSDCPDLAVKGATAGLAFSSPRVGRRATISLAWVTGIAPQTCEGTGERRDIASVDSVLGVGDRAAF